MSERAPLVERMSVNAFVCVRVTKFPQLFFLTSWHLKYACLLSPGLLIRRHLSEQESTKEC